MQSIALDLNTNFAKTAVFCEVRCKSEPNLIILPLLKRAVFLYPKSIGERKIKMKVFISQPMRGKTDTEITKERHKTISKAKELYGEDVEVIDSFFQSAPTDAKRCGFSVNRLSFFPEQMLRCSVPGGKMQEAAE